MMDAIVDLLNKLERIAESHYELLDTETREALHHALNYYFVWGHDQSRMPRHYRMFSPEGDRVVGQAIAEFLDAVHASGELSRVPPGQPRHDLLQSPLARTHDGAPSSDFFGSRDVPFDVGEPLPPDMLEEREYPADGEQEE